jgi:hypothetical protein
MILARRVFQMVAEAILETENVNIVSFSAIHRRRIVPVRALPQDWPLRQHES